MPAAATTNQSSDGKRPPGSIGRSLSNGVGDAEARSLAEAAQLDETEVMAGRCAPLQRRHSSLAQACAAAGAAVRTRTGKPLSRSPRGRARASSYVGSGGAASTDESVHGLGVSLAEALETQATTVNRRAMLDGCLCDPRPGIGLDRFLKLCGAAKVRGRWSVRSMYQSSREASQCKPRCL